MRRNGGTTGGTGVKNNPYPDREEFEARLLRSLGQAVIATDVDFEVSYWNAAAEELLGFTPEEAIGREITELLGIDLSIGRADEIVADLAAGLPVSDDLWVTAKDGQRFPGLVHLTPLLDDAGALVGLVAVGADITERKRFEHDAEEDRRRLREAQQLARVGSFEWDLTSGEMQWSDELYRLLEFPLETPVAVASFLERLHPDDAEAVALAAERWLERPDEPFEVEFRVVLPGGGLRWLYTRAELHDTISRHMAGSVQDVTERRESEIARRRAEERFSAAFEYGSVGMLIMDLERRVVRVNPAMCRLLGRGEREIVGSTPDAWTHRGEVGTFEESPLARLMTSDNDAMDLERRFVRPNGETVAALVHVAAVRNAAGEPEFMFAQVVDITDRKHVEEEMQRLAMHDPLTGLPNRSLLTDRLATALARASRSGRKVAVLFIDVDHFKLVNDSLGHATGDALLVQIARRLRRMSRGGDTVARFGGDEFVMVCEDVSEVSEAKAIGERVSKSFDEVFVIGEQPLYVTASTGIVVAEGPATPLTVLRDADAAMYRAKEQGRSRVELFDEALRHRAARRLTIEMALRHALEREEFRLAFQPIVSLPGETPVSVEALLRWEHPDRGTLGPMEFIGPAEEAGLIVAIGGWVLERAVEQLATWRRQLAGSGNLAVSVNVSPRQLISGDLLARCRDALAAHPDLSPSSLMLEITESAVMDDVEVSIPILGHIADSGIRIAIDDFGAGYSSLAYLKRLPVQILKIDRSFVDGLGRDPDDSSIVRAIVSLGHTLGLRLCAEGVETGRQRDELVELGCHAAQGYLWAPAMGPDHFTSWYERHVAGAGLAAQISG